MSAFLAVSDSGGGISANVLPRLFEPSVTTKPKGQGLGLATVKAIVESHGGSVHIESSAQGAKFEVEFPVADSG
jgi:signal transduction histidine kinase